MDESGDLGWKFDQPYRRGGSSRHLTIAAVCIPSDLKNHPRRLVRKLYQKFDWPTREERKWTFMTDEERLAFAIAAKKLCQSHPGLIKYKSITVYKPKVSHHIRQDANKLYNYMIGLLLLNEMASHETVSFVPDPRSIKVESGNSLHDYLQTQIWFQYMSACVLTTKPCDSSKDMNVQFADMISGIVQSHYEDGRSEPMRALRPCIMNQNLYFPHPSLPESI
ncbi:DUF3800 domain-containing protein [Pseudomonas luteola]|uniref:DUF3800 domain-containing protein n=1 Tax=Pseudomonas luteola TaxID=47886 RepID=UPI00142ED460|nr:DUF3800 domain-containing protein [Pseudomonas luteola]